MYESSGLITIDTLLNKASCLRIPIYQRDYVWGQENLDQFWDDVNREYETDDDMQFIGPIVMLSTPKNKEYEIIDGQQRLTTIMVALSVIRDAYHKYFDAPPSRINDKVGVKKEYAAEIQELIAATDDFRLQPSLAARDYLIDYVFMPSWHPSHKEYSARSSGLSKETIQRTKALRKAHDFFSNKVADSLKGKESDSEKISVLDGLKRRICERILILEITAKDRNSAHVLFESLNNRGVRLSGADLLKNLVIESANSEKERKEYAEEWESLVKKFGGKFTFFLRYVLLAYDGKVREVDVFESFNALINGDSKGKKGIGVGKCMAELKELAGPFSVLIDKKKKNSYDKATNNALDGLRGTGMVTHNSLILRGMQVFCPPEADDDIIAYPKEFLELAHLVEVISYRVRICGGNAQVLALVYHKLAKKYREEGKAAHQTVMKELREELARWPDDVFISSFLAEERLNPSMPDAKYVLQKIESSFLQEYELDMSKVHLEHLAPQTLDKAEGYWASAILGISLENAAGRSKTDYSEEEQAVYTEIVGQWGNLALVLGTINIFIKNSPWPRKRAEQALKKDGTMGDALGRSRVLTTLDLCRYNDWTSDKIAQRNMWIAETAAKLWKEKPENVQPFSFKVPE